VPTFAEGGLPGYDYKAWFGLLAPTGTPQEAVDKMSAAVNRIVNLPQTREQLLSRGMEPFVLTPAHVTALITADVAKYAKVIKAAKIKIDL
jgi:tripartite-type tricarboxylate transporter receptor subunit TctC